MNQSKRAFLKTASAVAVTLSMSSLAAFAAGADGVVIDIEGYDGDKGPFKNGLTLNKEQLGKLQEMDARTRPRFLSDLILRLLKRMLPEVPWSKVQEDMGRDIAAQLAKQLAAGPGGWGDGGGEEPLPKIKIRLRVKFKPPSNWEISLEIDF